jgi:hypothetical protein
MVIKAQSPVTGVRRNKLAFPNPPIAERPSHEVIGARVFAMARGCEIRPAASGATQHQALVRDRHLQASPSTGSGPDCE